MKIMSCGNLWSPKKYQKKLWYCCHLKRKNILKILKRLDDEDGVPFNDVLLKVWTCISEPDSVDAQKYLNEKAIAEVIKVLREKSQP